MFVWPPGAQQRTKTLISQILWTLWLDFEGVIEDSKDAPKELIAALRSHGIDGIPDMKLRLMLPDIAGGKYGTFIERTVLDSRRTSGLRLVSDLPEPSHLPDGAGKAAVDSIDAQLFGDLSVSVMPARGDTRDSATSIAARGDTRDDSMHPARGDTRDSTRHVQSSELPRDDRRTPTELARESTRDHDEVHKPASGRTGDHEVAAHTPASGRTGDDEVARRVPASGSTGDDDLVLRSVNEFDVQITALDAQAAELLEPRPGPQGPRELLDSIHQLVGALETQLAAAVAADNGAPEQEHTALLEEKNELLSRSARLLRRVKDAEDRLIERNKENEGLRTQLKVLQERYDRLDANMEVFRRGERAGGQHLRTTEKFIAERPHERRGGDASKLVYTVGG